MPVRDDPAGDPRYEWVVRWRIYPRDNHGRIHCLRRSRAFPMTPEGTVKSQSLFKSLRDGNAVLPHARHVGGLSIGVRPARPKAPPRLPQPNNRDARRAQLRAEWARAHGSGT